MFSRVFYGPLSVFEICSRVFYSFFFKCFLGFSTVFSNIFKVFYSSLNSFEALSRVFYCF